MLVGAALASATHAKVFLTVEDALTLAFAGCTTERSTVFLTEAQKADVASVAGTPLSSAVVSRYQATCDGEVAGHAYLDTHRVRTLPETLLISIDAEDRVHRIEILAFREPEDYIPSAVWYHQFDDRPLSDRLQLKRDIHGVTGATLTARATTDAVRRVLALHQVLQAPQATSDAERGASP